MSFEQTQNYQAYVRYRELKQQWRLIYKGVNLVEACALDLTDALVVQRKADFYHVVCAMLQWPPAACQGSRRWTGDPS